MANKVNKTKEVLLLTRKSLCNFSYSKRPNIQELFV